MTVKCYYKSEVRCNMKNAYLTCHKHNTPKPDTSSFHMHAHDLYEIFCFLKGDAKYYIEGNIYNLKPRDVLFIKRAEAHSLLINTQVPYERIVINFHQDALLGDETQKKLAYFDSLPLGVGNKYPASMFKNKNWQYYINKILSTDSKETKGLYLSVLVSELYDCSPMILNLETEKDGFSDIIDFLNEHMYEPLSLESICDRFYISKSHLNRKFKLMTGSTVWEYITAKRLLSAKELLQLGEPPTKVFSKCGFNDYSSFFRAYKAKFGLSPKNEADFKRKNDF